MSFTKFVDVLPNFYESSIYYDVDFFFFEEAKLAHLN
jgi:hypothetical protein